MYTGHEMEPQRQCANAKTNNTAADLFGFSSAVLVPVVALSATTKCISLSAFLVY